MVSSAVSEGVRTHADTNGCFTGRRPNHCTKTSDGATRRMSPTSLPRSVSNENRFQILVYRESKITYHIPDKQLKLSQKHKCGDFMWLNTVMSPCV